MTEFCEKCGDIINEVSARSWKKGSVATYYVCPECDYKVEKYIRNKRN